MATSKPTLERVYNVPLRKEYQKSPRWRRTKKAVNALREFLQKHMKSEDVKVGKEVNELLWQHGIRNPPHHIKVTVTKDDKGVVRAELFGLKKEEPKAKAPAKKTPVKKAAQVKEAVTEQ
ncbi:60S ribosomal protein L31 [Candidatus Woesearchaeota archaeon]|nr:60S ribosomal protein L31 [Candidatus Woesearchaeota archaeon]